MGERYRILFVCMGNICRSPAAECVFRHQLELSEHKDWVECDSAGVIAEHSGESPDHRMQEELRKRSIPVMGSARQIQPDDLNRFDLILAMDKDNLSAIRSLSQEGELNDKIRLFSEFCHHSSMEEVPDPYYGGKSGFAKVVDLVEDGVMGLLSHLSDRKPPLRN